jgi:hypothetical protein
VDKIEIVKQQVRVQRAAGKASVQLNYEDFGAKAGEVIITCACSGRRADGLVESVMDHDWRAVRLWGSLLSTRRFHRRSVNARRTAARSRLAAGWQPANRLGRRESASASKCRRRQDSGQQIQHSRDLFRLTSNHSHDLIDASPDSRSRNNGRACACHGIPMRR